MRRRKGTIIVSDHKKAEKAVRVQLAGGKHKLVWCIPPVFAMGGRNSLHPRDEIYK